MPAAAGPSRRQRSGSDGTCTRRVREFVQQTLTRDGRAARHRTSSTTPDSVRVELVRRGRRAAAAAAREALDALQHIVNTGFRRELTDDRIVRRRLPRLPQGQGRRAEADGALHDGEGAKSTGTPQEMGPLNPYARRLVHLTVAEDPEMSSESIGDAFLKTVIISIEDVSGSRLVARQSRADRRRVQPPTTPSSRSPRRRPRRHRRGAAERTGGAPRSRCS